MNYQLTTLPNGVRVATAEMPHMASVSVGLWAAVGSRHEAARINGAAHFLEHLLFKGTRRRSARQISGEVEALGGYLEAFTAEDHTCYYAKAEAEHLEGLGDVLGDIYIHSKLPASEVERERGVIREEILMYRDQPAQVAEELLAETLWPGHPLGRPLAGTLESVAALRRDELLGFWRAGYHARSTVLAVAGRVRHEDVVARAARPLLDLPAGRVPRFTRWTGKTSGRATGKPARPTAPWPSSANATASKPSSSWVSSRRAGTIPCASPRGCSARSWARRWTRAFSKTCANAAACVIPCKARSAPTPKRDS